MGLIVPDISRFDSASFEVNTLTNKIENYIVVKNLNENSEFKFNKLKRLTELSRPESSLHR